VRVRQAQVPSAFTAPHSYFGQHVAGSVATCLAQAHLIAGHAVPVPPLVPVAGAERTHIGQW